MLYVMQETLPDDGEKTLWAAEEASLAKVRKSDCVEATTLYNVKTTFRNRILTLKEEVQSKDDI